MIGEGHGPVAHPLDPPLTYTKNAKQTFTPAAVLGPRSWLQLEVLTPKTFCRRDYTDTVGDKTWLISLSPSR